MHAFAFTATCLVILKETVPEIPYCSNAEQKDTHRTDAPTSHRGPDTCAKLVNPKTNIKEMTISHSFQAITISVCSVQEITRQRSVHNNDRPHPLTVLLVVQVLLYIKMHLAPHTPLFILFAITSHTQSIYIACTNTNSQHKHSPIST